MFFKDVIFEPILISQVKFSLRFIKSDFHSLFEFEGRLENI